MNWKVWKPTHRILVSILMMLIVAHRRGIVKMCSFASNACFPEHCTTESIEMHYEAILFYKRNGK